MLTYILDGGTIMIPLLILSILAFAIIIDRWRAFAEAQTDTQALRSSIAESMEEDNLRDALKTCRAAHGPLAAVMLTGLSKYRRMLKKRRSTAEITPTVSKIMEDYAPHALAGLEKRLNYLVLIASVSPLLGMTGTVTGMIKSFDKMAASAGLEPGAVAGGISEALLTTATGLIVAIPAIIAYNLFTKKIDEHTMDIEAAVTEVVDFISEHEQ